MDLCLCEQDLCLCEQDFWLCEQDAQQSDMMDLEIADYERTVHALNAQLSDQDSLITDLKAEISRMEERIQLMQTQIGMSVYVL